MGAPLAVRAGGKGTLGGTVSGFDDFGTGGPQSVEVDCYTSAYRVTGSVSTRFSRVGDIVNLAPTSHLLVERATVSEYAAPDAALSAGEVLLSLDELLFLVAGGEAPASRPEMRIPKRAVSAQLAIPPFRLTGRVHVSVGSRPADGLLNVTDRFVPMTDVAVTSAAHRGLHRTVAALAVQRRRAHLLVVADDERPDELLADVLDEATARSWSRRSPGERSSREER